jgi:hypothetical protein
LVLFSAGLRGKFDEEENIVLDYNNGCVIELAAYSLRGQFDRSGYGSSEKS